MAKKRYFPNNWEEYKSCDDDMFIPHTFDELMDWKVANWELPSSVCCMIRVTNVDTKRTKEHIYQSKSAAKSKIKALIDDPNIEFVVCDHEAIHFLTKPKSDND